MLLDEAKDLSLSIGEIFQCRLLCFIVYSTECQNTQALYFYRPFLPKLFVEAGFEEFAMAFTASCSSGPSAIILILVPKLAARVIIPIMDLALILFPSFSRYIRDANLMAVWAISAKDGHGYGTINCCL